MSEKKIVYAAVHKASINLMKGETVGDFTRELGKSCREHLVTKLNLSTADDVWLSEAFAQKAVCHVYKSNKSGGGSGYYMVDYKRDKKGAFTFGTIQEAKRQTVYKPTSDVQINKSLNQGWEPVSKSLWDGIL
jgi:hypothetical protein